MPTIKIHLGPILLSILDKIDNPIGLDILSHSTTTKNSTPIETDIDYIDLIKNEEDSISFLPLSRISNTPNTELYTSRNRQRTKLGKKIETLVGKEKKYSSSEIEKFLKEIKQYNVTFKESDFIIVSGEEISKYYDSIHNDYSEGKGSLFHSCMNNKNDTYFDIFKENKNCNLLIYNKGQSNKVFARALLWRNPIINGSSSNISIMDRVYITAEYQFDLFNAYAIKNGWWSRVEQTHDKFSTFREPSGKINSSNIIIPIEKTDFVEYPYIDTFYYMVLKGPLVNKYGKYLTNRYPTNSTYLTCRLYDGTTGTGNLDSNNYFDFSDAYGQDTGIEWKILSIVDKEDRYRIKTEIKLNGSNNTGIFYFYWKKQSDSIIGIKDTDFLFTKRPHGQTKIKLNKIQIEDINPIILEATKDSSIETNTD